MKNLSIRWRLTLWWASLFFLFGLLLLLAANVFVHVSLTALTDQFPTATREFVPWAPDGTVDPQLADALRDAAIRVRYATMLALLVLAAAAGGVGWWLAGRMLAPVRTITETARRISDTNLGDRIGVTGPRDELHELARAFDAMLGRLERGFEAQRAFSADASHELRTPLTLIRAELDVVLADPDATAEELAEATASIRHALEQSEDLIDRLLQLASAETIHDRYPVELDELVAGSLDVYVDGHDLAVRLDRQPALAHGDATLLARMVDNLVHNAVRHNQPRGWIRVATSSADGEVHLVVANSGPDLSGEEIGRLTDRFYRPDPARARDSGGSGLGLAIVAAIVRAHDGHATIDGVEGGGLEVRVDLPAAGASPG